MLSSHSFILASLPNQGSQMPESFVSFFLFGSRFAASVGFFVAGSSGFLVLKSICKGIWIRIRPNRIISKHLMYILSEYTLIHFSLDLISHTQIIPRNTTLRRSRVNFFKFGHTILVAKNKNNHTYRSINIINLIPKIPLRIKPMNLFLRNSDNPLIDMKWFRIFKHLLYLIYWF